jgi:methionine synthase II (cobalamin-independent)
MFTTTQVGSWPRSRALLAALREKNKGRMTKEAFYAVADDEIRTCVQHQVDAGMDMVVDGEHRRDNFYSFITDKIDGTQLMSLADMLDTLEDKAGFEEMLDTLDVPASAIRNPTCVGRISRREPLALEELKIVREVTDKPIKVALPGPYLLTRSMWVGAYTRKAYSDKLELGQDVVRVLREELLELKAAGVAFVQFDEPVLTEVVLSKECDRRTFM